MRLSFRVDNPHTRPFLLGVVIAEVRKTYPDPLPG